MEANMNKKLFAHGGKIFLVPIILLTACSLPGRNVGEPVPGPAAGATASPTVAPLPAGFAVRITSPAADARLPEGSPVDVTFTASGGPFLEFDLLADNALVTSQPVSNSEVQVSGTLQWFAPPAGEHTLTVEALDENKNTANAAVRVQIGSETNPAGVTPTGSADSTEGMQLSFVNLTDGGTVPASMVKSSDGTLKPLVIVKFRVSGAPALAVSLQASGLDIQDEDGHPSVATNPTGSFPFEGEFRWSPVSGGGEYTLVASAVSVDKSTFVQATAHVTVTGLPAFTPTPPPLDQGAARLRFTQLYQQLYGVNIPFASMQRFDSPNLPNRARWISAVYYKGHRYYIELFDDTHYELSPADYSSAGHRLNNTSFILCRPSGTYKILVVYVDYGNLTVDKSDALAQVPVFADWTNQLYDTFAKSQGFAYSPLHIQAEAAWIVPPPSPGHLLTAAQILAGTGRDPAQYDLVMEIDLDKNNTVGKNQWKGILDQGGGIALQGCGAYYEGNVNIWSVVLSTQGTQLEVHGNLSMDFNHELSHLFGMLDDWPFKPSAITSPDGQMHDDWIPYATFGWTDADGDGIPEIVDPTPYGTNGPQP
jgi:hypothetical protein